MQFSQLNRREFITLRGGAAMAARHPCAAAGDADGRVSARHRLRFTSICDGDSARSERTGYVEGQNVRFEYRWVDGH
jgi:hypothetical protein